MNQEKQHLSVTLAISRKLILCLGLLITALTVLYPKGELIESKRDRIRINITTGNKVYGPPYTVITPSREFIGTYNFKIHQGRTLAEALISISFTLGILWALKPPKDKKGT